MILPLDLSDAPQKAARLKELDALSRLNEAELGELEARLLASRSELGRHGRKATLVMAGGFLALLSVHFIGALGEGAAAVMGMAQCYIGLGWMALYGAKSRRNTESLALFEPLPEGHEPLARRARALRSKAARDWARRVAFERRSPRVFDELIMERLAQAEPARGRLLKPDSLTSVKS